MLRQDRYGEAIHVDAEADDDDEDDLRMADDVGACIECVGFDVYAEVVMN